MKRLIGRLGITQQIALVGALGVAGMLAIGAAYLIGNSARTDAQTRITQGNEQLALLGELKIGLLEARRAEKDFLLRRADDYITRHETAMRAAVRDVEALRRLLNGAPAVAIIDRFRPMLATYDEQFGRVVTSARRFGFNENGGLQGSLRRSVHEIEETLKAGTDLALTAGMLTMRRHEKDYLARGDARYIEEMKKAAGAFEQRLDASSLAAEQKAAIRVRLAAYQKDFLAAADSAQELAQSVTALTKIYAEAEPRLTELDTITRDMVRRSHADASAVVTSTSQALIGIIALVVTVVAALAWFVGRGIAAMLRNISALMHRLAGNDLSIQISDGARKDEIGVLSRSLQVFRDNAEAARGLEAEQRIEQQRKEARQQAIEVLIADFNSSIEEMLAGLATAAAEMHATSGSMSATAEETSQQASVVASASEEASANVQTVAAAAEELTSTVGEITRQVTQSATIVAKAVEEAETTNSVVGGLADAAQRIGDVVRLIQEIAAQTNLLALNATIEAARAGDAGRGFAVVASEVKALAQQTGKATEEIASQVATIQGATDQAVAAIQNIGRTIRDVSGIATAIAGAVEQQGSATSEISRNTVEAARGAEQVSSNITGVSQAASMTSEAATKVRRASDHMNRDTVRIRGTVGEFLQKIRAA